MYLALELNFAVPNEQYPAMNQLIRHTALGLSIGTPIAAAIYLLGVAPIAGARTASPQGSASRVGLNREQLYRLPKASRIRKPPKAYDTYKCPARFNIDLKLKSLAASAPFDASHSTAMFANAYLDHMNVFTSGTDYVMDCFYQASVNGITFHSDQLRTLPAGRECFSISGGTAGCYK